VGILTSAASAGTATFSGRTWSTYDTQTPYGGNQIEYSGAANVGTMRGLFNDGGGENDAAMITALTVDVGDKVSYLWHVSDEDRNLEGAFGGLSKWFSDATTAFVSNLNLADTPRVTNRLLFANSDRFNLNWYEDGTWQDSVFQDEWRNNGLLVEWEFTSSTTATAKIYNSSGATLLKTFNDTFSDVDNIVGFRVGLWDSEQTITLSNFTFTAVPEPTSLAAVGLAGLALLGRRRASFPRRPNAEGSA
jgi:hypothetical protein